MTELLHDKKTISITGYMAFFGAISMFIGAGFWGGSGTDLWQTLENHLMDDYLAQLEPVRQMLVIGTFFWSLGVLLLGTAITLMSGLSSAKRGLAKVVLVCVQSAVPVAIVSFITMLSLAIHPPSVEVAYVVGWIGARLDDIATVLIIGAGPLFLSLIGRGHWVPGWLVVWGYIAGLCGLMAIVGLMINFSAIGFILIPFGMGWMLASGIILIRRK